MERSSVSSKGALDGLLVADFSRVLAGPLATGILADLGAEVVKVERPVVGDDTRSWTPPQWNGVSTYFIAFNRNKRSLELDFKVNKDLDVAKGLAAQADVLIENFRPGVMAKFGLDYESVREENPGIVYCSVTGFGSSDVGRTLPGYDLLVQAMSGLMSLTGPPDGPAYKTGTAILDQICGLYATVAVLAALRARSSEPDSSGQYIEVSLFEAGLTALLNQGSTYLLTGTVPHRLGNRHPSIAPYETFSASNRTFVVAVGNQSMWRALCGALNMEDLVNDSRFATNDARVRNVDELADILQEVFVTRRAEFWIHTLRKAGVPAGLVHDVGEAFEFAEEVCDSPVWKPLTDGPITLKTPMKFSTTPATYRSVPPALGEHNHLRSEWR